jgi:DNA-binding XRE family transcriptional regulator
MSDDLERYIDKRKIADPEFEKDFEIGYENFKIGVKLKQLRELAGLSQEDIAAKLNTKRSFISRIENHTDEVKISTILNYAKALDKKIYFQIQ